MTKTLNETIKEQFDLFFEKTEIPFNKDKNYLKLRCYKLFDLTQTTNINQGKRKATIIGNILYLVFLAEQEKIKLVDINGELDWHFNIQTDLCSNNHRYYRNLVLDISNKKTNGDKNDK